MEIAKEKSEIFTGLKKNGIAIINSDNIWSDFLLTQAKKKKVKIHLFGHSKNSNTRIIKLLHEKEGSTISYDKKENLHLKYLNTTQAENVIATISVIKELNLNLVKFTKFMSRTIIWKGEKLTIDYDKNKKTFIIDDSYNANPVYESCFVKFSKIKQNIIHLRQY